MCIALSIKKINKVIVSVMVVEYTFRNNSTTIQQQNYYKQNEAHLKGDYMSYSWKN